jgi:hypothetical protein
MAASLLGIHFAYLMFDSAHEVEMLLAAFDVFEFLPISQIRKARLFCDIQFSSLAPHNGSVHYGNKCIALNQTTSFSGRISTDNMLLVLAAYASHAELVRGLIQRGADRTG